MKNLRFHRYTGLLIIAILLSSCTCLKYWENAQNDFSKGANLENQARFSSEDNSDEAALASDLSNLFNTSGESGKANTAAAFYAQAYEEISQAIGCESNLRQNDVFGNALAIKALLEWKLKNYDNAIATAESAKRELNRPGVPDSPRDRALMAALKGLVFLDMAFDSMTPIKNQLQENIENADPINQAEALKSFRESQKDYLSFIHDEDSDKGLIENALAIIDEAKTAAGASGDIQTYLIQSQLAGLKTWSVVHSTFRNCARLLQDTQGMDWAGREVQNYRTTRERYLSKLKERLDGEINHPIYKFWRNQLGGRD